MKKIKQNKVKNVQAPVAKASLVTTRKPVFMMPKGAADGRITVRHREYVDDIVSTVAFTAVPYAINPGLPNTFPWLSQIAAAYETYRFKRLRFIYETASSTTTIGSVVLAVDFDPADPAPASKLQALSYHKAVRGPVWNSLVYDCTSEDLHKLNQKFMRYGALTGADLLLYDVGNLFVCTVGTSGIIGELHVEYDVEFYTPQLSNSLFSNGSALIAGSGTFAVSTPFGSTTTIGSVTQPSIILGGMSSNSITFAAPGQYLLEFAYGGASVTVLPGTLAFTTALEGTVAAAAGAVVATNNALYSMRITVLQPNAVLTLSGGNLTNVTSGTFRLASYATNNG